MIDINSISLDFASFSSNQKELNDILKCLKTLYSTKEGTQPLDREFGLSTDFIGKPIPVAEALFTVEVMSKTEMYEPRVRVSNVTFVANSDGKVSPTIHLEEGEEDEY